MFAVVQFPGSNDDRDMRHALAHVLGAPARLVWHKEPALPPDTEAVLLPGGFSYGDYLRPGAMARFSPLVADVVRFAERGGLVLGTCNGFQVLCEAGLLPGVLLRNRDLSFLCEEVLVRVDRADTPFTGRTRPGEILRLPIKHGEGAWFAEPEALARLEARGGVVLRYCDEDGKATEAVNPNGTAGNVAGIVNEAGNVFGLMPHPEHACEDGLVGGTDGAKILGSLVDAVRARGDRR